MPTRLVGTACALLLLGTGLGCSKKPPPPEPETPFTPKAEHVALLSAYETPLTDALLRAYLQDRPEVEVRTTRRTPQEIEKAVKEGLTADLVIGLPATESEALARAGAFRPPASPICGEVPSEFREANGSWVGLTVSALAIGVNEELLKRKQLPPPRHWEDLAHPRYRGWVVLARPPVSRASRLFVAGVTALLHPKGWDFWRRLDKNLFQYAAKAADPARLIAGAQAMIAVDFDRRLLPQRRSGKKLSIHYPTPTFYELETLAFLKTSKPSAAVDKLVEWLCGDRGMGILEGFRAGVTKPYVEPKEYWKTRMSQIKLQATTTSARSDALDEWRRKFGN